MAVSWALLIILCPFYLVIKSNFTLSTLSLVISRPIWIILHWKILLRETSVQVVIRAARLRLVLRLFAFAASKDGSTQQLSTILVLTRSPGTLLQNQAHKDKCKFTTQCDQSQGIGFWSRSRLLLYLLILCCPQLNKTLTFDLAESLVVESSGTRREKGKQAI